MNEIEDPPSKRMKLDSTNSDKNNPIKDTDTNESNTSMGKNEGISNEENRPGTSHSNYVTQEELQKLREFQVLDEVNEDDSKDEDSDSSGKSDSELPDEEIEKMLDEDLPEGFKGVPKPKEKSYITRQKIVLEEKGINHFEVLPLEWMMVRHCSGMPVYMHRGSRVCTLSKPYFLGKGNTRRHDIPISAIPCLAYRKALEEEAKQKEIDRSIAEQIENGTWATDTQNLPQNNTAQKSGDKLENSNKEMTSPSNLTSIQAESTGNQFNTITKNLSNSVEIDKEIIANDVNESSQYSELINQSSECTNKSDDQPSESINGEPSESTNDQPSESTNSSDIQPLESTNDESNLPESSTSNGTECLEMNGLTEVVGSPSNNVEAQCPFSKESAARKPVVLPGGIVMPPPRVETVNTSWKTQHLSSEQVNDYCKNLFKFKTVNIMHFKRWADRRKYVKVRKTLQYPTLPEGTKLITIPANTQNGQENGGKATKRDWVMNMNGCSYLSVFHEYVRRALQKQPVYEFKQLENAASPYQATVYIGGMQYGVGHGSSKRQAKSAAARASIHILIPEMKDELDQHTRQPAAPDNRAEPDFTFFDYVGIEDPRIQEFCAATSEPSPHAILRTCLLRNFGAGERHIHTEMKKLEYQKISLTMKVGKHSATVVCKNKKQAKQRASQAILQALHPHIKSWGSLLRLYGSRSVKSCKEKKLEEQQITLLQDKAQQNEPNYAVLEKLRNEMKKLKERDEAVVPIGTLLVAEDLPTHSGSMLNNVDL